MSARPHSADDAATLRRLRLWIAFDGTGYHGWQSGRSGRGVADVVTRVLREIGAKGDLVSSSRTDSGVHAHGLIAHADVRGPWMAREASRIRDFLNAHLPTDIRILETKWMPSSFHARFDARWKEYRYTIWNAEVMPPLLTGKAWHVATPLDLAAMRTAARVLIGRHDFHAFTSRRDGTLASPTRSLTKLTVSRRDAELMITLRADGFLYKMCRGIVGTLVEVGKGRMTMDQVAGLLDAEAKRTPGMNAPSCGLILWKVGYGS